MLSVSSRRLTPADKKGAIENALGQLKEAHKSQNISDIDRATEALNNAWHAASEDMARAAQAGPSAGAGSQAGSQTGGGSSSDSGSNSGDDNVTSRTWTTRRSNNPEIFLLI